jgi:hypothetical protein
MTTTLEARHAKITPELFGVPVSSDREEALVDAAIAAGWTLTDDWRAGRYSTVLVRDTEALKIFHDYAYRGYLGLTADSENGAFPVVLDGPIIGDGLSAVFLERLQPLEKQADIDFASRLGQTMQFVSAECKLRLEDREFDGVRDRMGPEGLAALRVIYDFGYEYQLLIDISDFNIMLRAATGELVFSDPLAPG